MLPKLSEAEKKIMEILWEKKEAFLKDILEEYPEPKSATTTIATMLKRLQNKKWVGYTLYGNSRAYVPLVEKGKFFNTEMKGFINQFFNNSVTQFASFFTSNTEFTKKELEELRKIIDTEIQKK